jgi:hypothetical protein
LENLPIVICVMAAWLVLFVFEFPAEANIAHSFVVKLRKFIDSTTTPAPAMPYKSPPLPKFDARDEFPATPRK